MVVEEKGLIAAMKDAYKSEGYKLAVDLQGGIESVMIASPMWTVVIRKSELPRKVLSLIVEHTGETYLEPALAYQVKKKETQAEIFDIVIQSIQDFCSGEKDRRIARRTNLVLGGYPLWQGATDQRVVKVYPDYEDIMSWGNRVVRLIGDDLLMVDDDVSRLYIRCTSAKDAQEAEKLTHLGKIQWAAQ